MLGLVNAEFICSPRDNEEYRRIRAAKEEALKSKHKKLNLLQGEAATALIRTGMTDATTFSTTAPEKKKRPQENKATRMDESSLIDALTELFRQYRFWPIASIKSRLKQPEAYLREVLGRIGTLVKTGQAANTWTLNDTYLASLELSDDLKSQGFKEEGAGSVKAEEVAPIKVEDADGDMSMDDDDDDDDDDEDDFVQA
jgi:transcription initiation factor TFIIF subunit beta